MASGRKPLLSALSHPAITTLCLLFMVVVMSAVLVVLVRMDMQFGAHHYLNPHGDILTQMEENNEWHYAKVLRETRKSGWAALRRKLRSSNDRFKRMRLKNDAVSGKISLACTSFIYR